MGEPLVRLAGSLGQAAKVTRPVVEIDECLLARKLEDELSLLDLPP